jgi:hypothetical protein
VRVGTDRRNPPVKDRGHAHTGGWAWWVDWAELAFPFSRELLMAFLFIFSRILNSNSNQVSNSN